MTKELSSISRDVAKSSIIFDLVEESLTPEKFRANLPEFPQPWGTTKAVLSKPNWSFNHAKAIFRHVRRRPGSVVDVLRRFG